MCDINCRWDEWVPASRLLKLNEENVAVQKALQAQANAANASAASSSKHKSGGGHKDGSSSKAGLSARKDGSRGTKRGREEVGVMFSLFLIVSFVCLLIFRSS
jgi:mortality factor 4-like protein 1